MGGDLSTVIPHQQSRKATRKTVQAHTCGPLFLQVEDCCRKRRVIVLLTERSASAEGSCGPRANLPTHNPTCVHSLCGKSRGSCQGKIGPCKSTVRTNSLKHQRYKRTARCRTPVPWFKRGGLGRMSQSEHPWTAEGSDPRSGARAISETLLHGLKRKTGEPSTTRVPPNKT